MAGLYYDRLPKVLKDHLDIVMADILRHLNGRDARIQDLEVSLSDKEAALAEKNAMIAIRDAQIEELEMKLQEVEDRRAFKEHEVRVLLALKNRAINRLDELRYRVERLEAFEKMAKTLVLSGGMTC